MAENSKIEWCDHTFNPAIGCTKVSPGCAHCYAEAETFARVQRSKGRELWGKGKPRHRTSAAYWKQPLKWNEHAIICNCCGNQYIVGGCLHTDSTRRARVFCASMSDWLDEEWPIEWLADLLKLIHDTPNLDRLLLTKRPENFAPRLQAVKGWLGKKVARKPEADFDIYWCWILDWLTAGSRDERASRPMPPANVWIGVSVEDQQRANERIPELLKIPAKVRFLSVEPMLGPITFNDIRLGTPVATLAGTAQLVEDSQAGGIYKDPLSGTVSHPYGAEYAKCYDRARIHWAIFGGESGPNARPCNIEWIRNGVKQCRAAGVAPFVKQLGSNPFCDNANDFEWPDDVELMAAGSAFASCRPRFKDKKGGDMSEWPEDLKGVREFPC